MNYRETLDFLYSSLPMYQRVGKSAFKKNLDNIRDLCERLDNPQQKFQSIHIAGTNGKGSSAHMIASVLQEAGYNTGLYTSPHLKEFTERIRINGSEIQEDDVIRFVETIINDIEEIKPSFFEITVAMSFWYFAENKVDIAVVEVGLGGRLDSTNIIDPEVALITNISLDHMDMLGNTLQEIAGEKAGIIKTGKPVVISEYQEETAEIFKTIADNRNSPIIFAEDQFRLDGHSIEWRNSKQSILFDLDDWPDYQFKNLPGVLATLDVLKQNDYLISELNIKIGIENYRQNTSFQGRWQALGVDPLIICDTAHNEAGIKAIVDEFEKINYENLIIVWGMVADKDASRMLQQLPGNAFYYFCKPQIPRGMDAGELLSVALDLGIKGEVVEDVNRAVEKAILKAGENDMIYIGGSTFVVAELELK